jgi:hypothetical protein
MSTLLETKTIDALPILIDKMLELSDSGIKYEHVANVKYDWSLQYSITKEQNDKWKKWAMNYLTKELSYSNQKAKSEFDKFDMTYGLKIDNQINY